MLHYCLKLTHQLSIFVIKGEKLQIQVLSYEQPICDLRHPKYLEKFRSAPLATENLCELANTQVDVPYIMWKMAYLCTASVSQVAHLSSSRSVVPVGGIILSRLSFPIALSLCRDMSAAYETITNQHLFTSLSHGGCQYIRYLVDQSFFL